MELSTSPGKCIPMKIQKCTWMISQYLKHADSVSELIVTSDVKLITITLFHFSQVHNEHQECSIRDISFSKKMLSVFVKYINKIICNFYFVEVVFMYCLSPSIYSAMWFWCFYLSFVILVLYDLKLTTLNLRRY